MESVASEPQPHVLVSTLADAEVVLFGFLHSAVPHAVVKSVVYMEKRANLSLFHATVNKKRQDNVGSGV